jgi:hypothetical protein
MNLKETLEEMAKCQLGKSKAIMDTIDEPNGFKDMGETVSKIFKQSTDGRLIRELTGNGIINYSIPLQLMKQKTVMVDLTVSELMKEKPFGMPVDSIIDLAESGHLYLNLREYDLSNTERNVVFFEGQAAENLEKLLGSSRRNIINKMYFGNALRNPIFNKLLYWQGIEKKSFEDYQKEFFAKSKNAHDACEQFDKSPNDFEKEFGISCKWLDEKQTAIAASWHYAYLKSAKHLITRDDGPNIFMDHHHPSSIDAQLELCAYRGEDWAKDKNNEEKKKSAALSFAFLADKMRAFHVLHTIQITGTWGCFNWNRPRNDYNYASKSVSEHIEPGVTSTPEYQQLVYTLMNKEGYINSNPYKGIFLEMPCINYEKKEFTRGEIDNLIRTLELNADKFAQLAAVNMEVDKLYQDGDGFDIKQARKIHKEYSDISSFISGNIAKSINVVTDVVTDVITARIPSAGIIMKAAMEFLKKHPKILCVFRPAPENRVAFKLYDVFHNHKSKK